MTYRQVAQIYTSQPTTDGDGVKINRSVVNRKLGEFDPFLLLDEIESDEAADYMGGFPEHPHRGFETVTYMKQGKMRHRDHMGNEGLLEPGSVQWMTAGKGVLHSEMPEQIDGTMHGFQLWINLPASEKMTDPKYREYSEMNIPTIPLANSSYIKVIAGHYSENGKVTSGPIQGGATNPDYFDLHLNKNTETDLTLKSENTALVYVYQGELSVKYGETITTVKKGQMAKLSSGERVSVTSDTLNTGALILSGKPLAEPIANWGPFVMNTQEEIEQAIEDYRNGVLV